MEYSKPFFHACFDNFLSKETFTKIENFYKSKTFDLKYTDLFKFLQTEELANNKECTDFKKELDTVFKKYVNLDETFYTIFASYYRKGDFLSCHDDMIDGRMYAFTFYLEDLDSGDLILFNNECTKEEKSILIRKNRLVIFEVSAFSFHEVQICKHEGRKAITGWLNKSSHRLDFSFFKDEYLLPEIEKVPFEIPDDDFLVYEGMQYNFEASTSILEGPFVNRRMISLNLDTFVALDIPDFELLYIKAFRINNESYILLNDFTNQYEGDVLDIFIIESSTPHPGNIKVVNENGELVQTLEILENVMYVIKRKSMKYFIERSHDVEYNLVHMIYKRKDVIA